MYKRHGMKLSAILHLWHNLCSNNEKNRSMKKMILLFSSLAITALATHSAHAQRGDIGLGARLTPDGAGFTGKFFLTKDLAFEAQLNAGGIFAFEGESVNAVGLLEYHISLPNPQWRLFFGGGMHIGAWDRGGRWDNGRWEDDNDFIFGIDGIGGVEYRFRKFPLGLSGDFKPAINFVSDVDFFPHNMIGVSGRYYFGRGTSRGRR